MKHYLLTIYLSSQLQLHGYLMCTDDSYVAPAINRMFDAIEKAGATPLPVILQTDISDAPGMVRKLIGDLNAKAKDCIATATDYHFSCWAMGADHPAAAALLALH